MTYNPEEREIIQANFLKAYAETHLVVESARRAHVDVTTIYDWRDKYEDFAARYAEARRAALADLEDVAFVRATQGTAEPVFQKGQRAVDVDGSPATIMRYDNKLLALLLRAHDPLRYSARHQVALAEDKFPTDPKDGTDAQLIALIKSAGVTGEEE